MLRRSYCYTLLLAMSLAFLTSCSKQPSEPQKPDTDPAIQVSADDDKSSASTASILNAAEYSDGGTTFVHLMTAEKSELLICVSQAAFEANIPPNTLFVGANHPNMEQARLPLSTDEGTQILETLRSAVTAALTVEQLAEFESWGDPLEHYWQEQYRAQRSNPRPIKEWKAIFAFDALRRLESKEQFDIHNKSASPEWYEQFEKKRRELLAEQQKVAELDERFKSFYPETARNLFNIQSFDENAIEAQGRSIANEVNDPVRLAAITCRAFGAIDDSWNVTTPREQIATQAMLTVSSDDFIAALPEVVNDREALLGAGRIFFYLRYGNSFSESAWKEWGPKITAAVLTDGVDANKSMVLRMLAQCEHSDVVPLLTKIARGELGTELETTDRWDQEPGLQASAYLALSQRGEESLKAEIQQLLSEEKVEQDQAALEVCLALLGDPGFIKSKHFDFESYSIGFGALRAIERFEGKHGMEVLMSEALEHQWAAVANEALLVAQRITGQEWLPKGSNHQPRNFSSQAKAWWKENGQQFTDDVRSE